MRPPVQNPRIVHPAVVVGQTRFGNWRVIDRAPKGPRGQERVRVLCEGGACAARPTERIIDLTKLRQGLTSQCRTCAIHRVGRLIVRSA